MPDFDILCAGFPCQAFSNGGKKKCFEDDRGLLFDEIIRIFDVKNKKDLGSLQGGSHGHEGSITSLQFYKNEFLISSAEDS
jgi:WD40 repeat protein